MNNDVFGETISPFLTGFFDAEEAGGGSLLTSTSTSDRQSFDLLTHAAYLPREFTKRRSGRLSVTTRAMGFSGRMRGLDNRNKALTGAYKILAKGPAKMTRRVRHDFQPEDCQFGPLEGITITPPNYSGELPDLFYLHGGGYSAPPSTPHWWLVAELAEKFGTRVHCMRYPLIPESTAKETVAAAVKGFLAATKELGEAPIVGGDSSGGGLSLALTLSLRDIHATMPAHLILFAPWIDLTASTPGFDDCVTRDPLLAQAGIDLAAEIYAGALDRRNPIVSPLFGDPTGLCPTTVILGTNDALYAEGSAWVDKAEQAGVDVGVFTAKGGFHVFPAATFLPESHAALNYIHQRLSSLTKEPANPEVTADSASSSDPEKL